MNDKNAVAVLVVLLSTISGIVVWLVATRDIAAGLGLSVFILVSLVSYEINATIVPNQKKIAEKLGVKLDDE